MKRIAIFSVDSLEARIYEMFHYIHHAHASVRAIGEMGRNQDNCPRVFVIKIGVSTNLNYANLLIVNQESWLMIENCSIP